SSATDAPASCSFRMLMICSSVYRDRFIVRSPSGPDSTSSWPSFRGAGQSTIYIPWGTYRLESDWVIDRGVHVIGAYRMGSVLAFAAGKSMRLNSQGVRTTNPPSTVKRLYIRCEKLPVGDWQPKHPYSAGDLVHGTLSYGSQRNGFHYQCVEP